MDEIARRKAEKAANNDLWSPLDALEDAAESVRTAEAAGRKVMLAVHWWEQEEDGGREMHFCAAKLNRPEHIALLEMAKLRQLENWKA
jgi:hypothetical protein